MIYHTCVRCGLTDANVLDLDTGGAYHPELRGCISMLRDRLATVEAERDALRDELTQQSITLSAEHQRAERILAALREPSEAVVKAMVDATPVSVKCGWLQDAIRAAVEAAEKEVSHDPR